MTVVIEAYRCAVGQFALIFVTLLLKKEVKTARKVHDSEVFTGEVCSGTDIAVFFAWLVLSSTLLFSAPFCVHMAFCRDVYTAKHSMYDSFLLIPNANRLCSAMQIDLLLDNGVSAFSAMTLQQTGPLVSHPLPPTPAPPSTHPTSDFCCCCAATLNPTLVLHGLKTLSSAWKPRSTVKQNAWKENSIN